MAIEALAHFRRSGEAASSLQQIVRREGLCAHRQVEALQGGEVTHAALIPTAFGLEEIGLARRALTEGPVDGDADGLMPIRNHIDELIADARNFVGVPVN